MKLDQIEKLQLWGINAHRELSCQKWQHLDSAGSSDEKPNKIEEYRSAYGDDWCFEWRSECDGAGWVGPVEGSASSQ